MRFDTFTRRPPEQKSPTRHRGLDRKPEKRVVEMLGFNDSSCGDAEVFAGKSADETVGDSLETKSERTGLDFER